MTPTLKFFVHRVADNAKYPLPVDESYTLEKGVLHYSAYFYNMPIDQNHQDSIEWESGEFGKNSLSTAMQLIDDSQSGLTTKDLRSSSNDSCYYMTVTKHGTDINFYVSNPQAKAWIKLNEVFKMMIKEFEKKTGRPYTPEQLSQ